MADSYFVLGDYLNQDQVELVFHNIRKKLKNGQAKTQREKVDSIYDVIRLVQDGQKLGNELLKRPEHKPFSMFRPVIIRNTLDTNTIDDLYNNFWQMAQIKEKNQQLMSLFDMGQNAEELYRYSEYFFPDDAPPIPAAAGGAIPAVVGGAVPPVVGGGVVPPILGAGVAVAAAPEVVAAAPEAVAAVPEEKNKRPRRRRVRGKQSEEHKEIHVDAPPERATEEETLKEQQIQRLQGLGLEAMDIKAIIRLNNATQKAGWSVTEKRIPSDEINENLSGKHIILVLKGFYPWVVQLNSKTNPFTYTYKTKAEFNYDEDRIKRVNATDQINLHNSSKVVYWAPVGQILS